MVQTLACLVLAATTTEPSTGPQAPFQERGYYITFMRMPTYDLGAWKHVVDGIHDDGGNLLLLWMAGAFRSPKYRAVLTKLQAMEQRHREAKSEGERQLYRIAKWVLAQWEDDNRALLEVTRE